MADRAVLVTNLSTAITKDHLRDLFSACGNLASIEIEQEGFPAARCLIVFRDASSASTAAMLDGTALGDIALRVSLVPYMTLPPAQAPPVHNAAALAQAAAAALAVEASVASGIPMIHPAQISISQPATLSLQNAEETQRLRTIYIGNLSPDVLTEHVIQFFSSIGPIINIKMCPGGGQTTAHAFVEFSAISHAQQALSRTGTEFFNRPVKIGMAENPIAPMAGSVTASDQRKHELALAKVREAQERLERKHLEKLASLNDATKASSSPAGEKKSPSRGEEHRSKSRSEARKDEDSNDEERKSRSSKDRSHRRRRSHRSRSRDRGHRSSRSHRHRHSRSSRHGSRSKSRSRSRGGARKSRSPRRSRSPRMVPRFTSARDLNYSRPSVKKKAPNHPVGKIWDGFQWVDPAISAAVDAAASAPASVIRPAFQMPPDIPSGM